ncbi:MAG: MarR family transcriptional regulator [Christensenellaceae bacterium]|nr:MarR family transcriptional regulator [Christensenellaceae bacterium]
MDNIRENVRRLMLAMNIVDEVFAYGAKKIGISENALSLLYALDDGEIHTQSKICENWLIPKSTINTIVKDWVNKGYIELIPGRNIKEKHLQLTDLGKDYASSVLLSVYTLEDLALIKTLKSFSPDFINAVEAFSSNLHDEFKNYFEKTKPAKLQ